MRAHDYNIRVLHVPGFDPYRDDLVTQYVNEWGAEVHEDTERIGCLPNLLRCLEAAQDDDSEWTIKLDDDAFPHPGARECLPKLLSLSPTPLLGLWRTVYDKELLAASASYVVGLKRVGGVAYAIHRSIRQPLYEWVARAHEAFPHLKRNAEVFPSLWTLAQGYSVASVTRCPFGHDTGEVRVSTIGNHKTLDHPRAERITTAHPYPPITSRTITVRQHDPSVAHHARLFRKAGLL